MIKVIKPKKPAEPDLRNIQYMPKPYPLDDLWKPDELLQEGENKEELQKPVTQILAQSHYSYAVVGSRNEVYAWGFGENFVLGNRKDENIHRCNERIDVRMFKRNKVLQVQGGSQHIAVLVKNENIVMEKDDDGKDTNVEVSRNTPPDPVLDLTKWTKYPPAEGDEDNAAG